MTGWSKKVLRLLTLLLLSAGTAQAAVQLNINDSTFRPLPIAIPQFRANDARAQQFAANVSQVIANDLASTGLFKIINTPELEGIGAESMPDFNTLRSAPMQVLNAGTLKQSADGGLQADFRLWDVPAGEQIIGQSMASTPDGWRRIGHKIADAIYVKMTGEKPYFDSRVTFVDESGPKRNRTKRLAVMDQDGANVRYLTDGALPVLTPRFSPVSSDIVYVTMTDSRIFINLVNADTGRRERLTSLPGTLAFSPAFSPDGNKITFSAEYDGNTDIYTMDLRSRAVTRLTGDPSIETSPSFAPDGSRIAFNSDRGGSQQLYVMSNTGGGVRRLSFGSGRYATPQWSPRGDKLAFTKMSGGRFAIGTMDADGGNERILSESFLDEGPTWAPNGRVLMFFRQSPGSSGATRLYQVDASGRLPEHAVPTPRDASDPSWSGLRR